MRREEYRRASAEFCFGREMLCNDIRVKSFEKGSVLLFGGRQAGKTTVMHRIVKEMGHERADVGILSSLDLPVYVDLASLPAEATPRDFFRLLAGKASAACALHIRGFQQGELSTTSNSGRPNDHLGWFIKDLLGILVRAGETDLRFLFLLDEAKRVLGGRFPRGFQDNLFSLLYGEYNDISGRIAIIFAGAQDLLKFCEDETSPIGSRAGQCFLPCLDLRAVTAIVNALDPDRNSTLAGKVAQAIFKETGGHAGLTVRLTCKYFAQTNPILETITGLADYLVEDESMLFRIWTESLSKEARAIHPLLFETGQLNRQEISAALRKQELDPFRSTTVAKEYVFTGIALEDDSLLKIVNDIYCKFVLSVGGFPVPRDTDFTPFANPASLQRKCWEAIEELELKLREYIVKIYQAKWKDSAISMMRSALGDTNWGIIELNRSKAAAQYPLCREKRCFREVDGMYTGQLIQLILWNKAWPLFKSYLPNKREIERWRNEVTPVRNDQAHFRKVPEKELNRCWLACDDFVVAIDKAAESYQFGDR